MTNDSIRGGDYVLAVKDNQPKLHQAIATYFDDRAYYLAKLPGVFAFRKQWPSVRAIGMAVRATELRDGTTHTDVRYFIASRYLSGERFAQSVRGHWGIEQITAEGPEECLAGEVLQGHTRPHKCPAFGLRCTPDLQPGG